MYPIAIPSAKRENSKYFKTIPLLRNIGYDMSYVYLFLPNDSVHTYIENYKLDDINIVSCNNNNIVTVRNYIEKEYFPNKTKLVCMDDDIEYLIYKDNYTNDNINDTDCIITRISSATILQSLLDKCFSLAIANDCLLWGVYPIARNVPWFRETKTNIGNNHILASFSGVIVDNTLPYQNVSLACKEEYERAFIYGKNIRVGFIAISTKYYTNDGIGIRPPSLQLQVCNRIIEKYPGRYSKTPLKIKKKDGIPKNYDMRLNIHYYTKKKNE